MTEARNQKNDQEGKTDLEKEITQVAPRVEESLSKKTPSLDSEQWKAERKMITHTEWLKNADIHALSFSLTLFLLFLISFSH